ncbi:MAG: hypothetical protein JWL85_31 [Candidatus Saccharibacteria bacterium]|nr:hypothetical protein [Candidatus Saccharibacteria bacterium]
MWPFKKKNNQVNQTEVPQEIKEYYQAERRERKGIAGLLALATLVVTVLLALGLFYGGRWAYRTLTNNDKQTAQTTNQQQTTPAKDESKKTETKDNGQGGATQGAQTAQPPQNQQGGQTSSAVTNTPGNATTPDAGRGAGEVSGANSNIPNTGPEHVIGIVVLVAVSSALAHRLITVRRFERNL